MNGIKYYCDSKKKVPKWKSYLDQWAEEEVDISENSSNKAIMLVEISDRIMAVVFGYGRSFLKEECIERNFGFKVALNIINPNKMRSVNAATIEDMVVTTQRQASYSTSQDEFDLNVTNDIMRGITGEPYDEAYGNQISGKDSLVVTVYMELSELKEKLELYYTAFNDTRYKDIGFEWVDNISEVRDGILAESLDGELCTAIENHITEHLHIAPPETTDWTHIIGFCYSGNRKKLDDPESYTLNLDITDYIENLRQDTAVGSKIRRDKLFAMNADGTPFAICSIYAALVYQTEYDNKNYILCAGTWYHIETSFFNQVNEYIRTQVPLSTLALPDCPKNFHEGEYNALVTNSNKQFFLMDCKLLSVEGGPKKIESCDIYSMDKQFIHVKNKTQSAQLSHLFAQGKISAECFSSDITFRKQISEIVFHESGIEPFDYNLKPQSSEYEVVYAIIDDEESDLNTKLPFFSKVNLMLTAQELSRMHFKYSVCLIKKERT